MKKKSWREISSLIQAGHLVDLLHEVQLRDDIHTVFKEL